MWNYMYDAVCFIASQSLWESLSEDDQILFAQAAKEAMNYEREVVRGEDKSLIGKLEEQGMTITELTDSEMKAFQDAIRPVYEEFKNKLGKDTVELFESEVAKTVKK
jgi:TRAP-type C4-dicarboxylate transport system substrate-binding protein